MHCGSQFRRETIGPGLNKDHSDADNTYCGRDPSNNDGRQSMPTAGFFCWLTSCVAVMGEHQKKEEEGVVLEGHEQQKNMDADYILADRLKLRVIKSVLSTKTIEGFRDYKIPAQQLDYLESLYKEAISIFEFCEIPFDRITDVSWGDFVAYNEYSILDLQSMRFPHYFLLMLDFTVKVRGVDGHKQCMDLADVLKLPNPEKGTTVWIQESWVEEAKDEYAAHQRETFANIDEIAETNARRQVDLHQYRWNGYEFVRD